MTTASTVAAKRNASPCCRTQIEAVIAVLETDLKERSTPYWFGERIGHADIAVAAVLRFIGEAHPGLVSITDFPALKAHAARMEALPVFQAVMQPFVAPA